MANAYTCTLIHSRIEEKTFIHADVFTELFGSCHVRKHGLGFLIRKKKLSHCQRESNANKSTMIRHNDHEI